MAAQSVAAADTPDGLLAEQNSRGQQCGQGGQNAHVSIVLAL